MKKCASCSKDLPEAALHCVFCGAKQAMTPAAPSPHAKTSFGYSANDVMQQLGNPQPSYQQPPQARANRPSQAPGYTPPSSGVGPSNPADAATVLVPASGGAAGNFNAQPAYAATDYGGTPSPFAGNASPAASYGNPAPGYGNPGYGNPSPAPSYGNPSPGYGAPSPAPSYGNPSPGYGGAPSPAPSYGNPSPAPSYGNPSPGYGAPSPLGSGPMGGGMGIHAQHQHTTPAGVPVAPAPYLASSAAARAGRPIEPWKDALKFMMLVWGAVALATFATPAHVDPMGFMWDVILHGQGKQKLFPLIWASVGIVSIVCAVVPLDSLPRGIVAAVLGLAGIVVPVVTAEAMPPWQLLLPMLGMLALIPGLLIRHEYVESIVPRIMVTVGVVAVLVPYLIPANGQIPLVGIFKGLIEAPGELKIAFIVDIVKIVVVVTTLLVWMPGPATGGGKILAWVLLLFAVGEFAIDLALAGKIDLIVKKSPIALVMWAPALVFSVLWSYGSATIIGKQLE